MSVVTNLMLCCCTNGYDNTTAIQDVNQYFVSRNIKGLVSVISQELPTHWYGGNKNLEARIYLGVFNHLNLEEFLNHVRNVVWDDPDCVQLIVKRQSDFRFEIINVFEL